MGVVAGISFAFQLALECLVYLVLQAFASTLQYASCDDVGLTAQKPASSEISHTNCSFCFHWSTVVALQVKDRAECFKKRSH